MKRHHQVSLMTLLLSSCFAINAAPLTIATWNMQWLSSTPSANFTDSQRSAADILAYRQLFAQFKPAVLSFQEVNDIEIVRSIVGEGYNILLSDRASPNNQRYQFNDINQYTGFAIKKSLSIIDAPDVILSNNRKLRFASYVIIQPHEKPAIHLLNVHLKAGCINQYRPSNSSCKQLKQQAQKLNEWILQRTKHNEQYVISGDFNHNLAHPKDWMWLDLTKGITPTPELETRFTTPDCKVKNKHGKTIQYPSVIDHVIASAPLSVDRVQQITYPQAWLNQYKLSDHCPISATIN